MAEARACKKVAPKNRKIDISKISKKKADCKGNKNPLAAELWAPAESKIKIFSPAAKPKAAIII